MFQLVLIYSADCGFRAMMHTSRLLRHYAIDCERLDPGTFRALPNTDLDTWILTHGLRVGRGRRATTLRRKGMPYAV